MCVRERRGMESVFVLVCVRERERICKRESVFVCVCRWMGKIVCMC